MYLSILVTTTLAVLTTALPTQEDKTSTIHRRAPVFQATTYNLISISGGVAGNAKQEAIAKLSSFNSTNLTAVDAADLTFLNNVNQACNDAEKQVFNIAVANNATSQETRDAAQRGKIKNKVLKLMATKLKLEAQAAQGKNVTQKQTEENTKLAKNIQLDIAAAGLPSTALSFDAVINSTKLPARNSTAKGDDE